MRHLLWLAPLALFLFPQLAPAQQAKPKVIASGLNNPVAITVAPNGKVFVTVIGTPGKKDDGAVVLLDNGKAIPFCTGLNEPTAIAAFQKWLYVTGRDRVWKIDASGKAEVLAPPHVFPAPTLGLIDIAVDPESGMIYVTDTSREKPGVIYWIDQKYKVGKVGIVTNKDRSPGLHDPSGLVLDGADHLLTIDGKSGILYRVNIATGKAVKVTEGLAQGGLAWDHHGQLFASDAMRGSLFGIPRPGQKPVQLPTQFGAVSFLCLDPTGKALLVIDELSGTVHAVPAVIPGWEVDTTPLKLETALAFPKIKWPGWEPMTPAGKPNEFRPLLLTHAGDGSNRVFVGTQHGIVYDFPNKPDVDTARIFLDISDRVLYNAKENEQGFLGMAFHPDFKKNGELYVYYSPKKLKLTNYLSRFRLSKDDPTRLDPASEEVLLEIKRPFWNHDGGTVVFGPDGYLYLALGDGGDANDVFNNAQDLTQPLGHILRLDVNNKENGKKYAIPKDNPFVGKPDAMPEIYAYGLRNVWRMSFDKKTGQLWAADVGQNLYEEINLIVKGGNYGWKLREGMHPFWSTGSGPRPNLIAPIWEYHHAIGKSITGGFVYRGEKFPELQDHYLYGDYVSGKIWALKYDAAKQRVVANHPIKDQNKPIMSWGEDEQGEAYLLTYSNFGQGIYKLVNSKTPASK